MDTLTVLIVSLTISLILLVAGIILITEYGVNLVNIIIILFGFILLGFTTYGLKNYYIISEEIYGKSPEKGKLSKSLEEQVYGL